MQRFQEVHQIPQEPERDFIYYLRGSGAENIPAELLEETSPGYFEPKKTPEKLYGPFKAAMPAYFERTDRNVGCLVAMEQVVLYTASIALIGLGGMGGYQADIYTRLGVGNLYIADMGTFDTSNINRQWGATTLTVGKDKATATADLMRTISSNANLFVCPSGLNEETADFLIRRRDVVIDMIEFWSIADRIWLHRTCQKYGVVAINYNSIVHASFGMRFDYRKKASAEDLGGYETLLERYMQMTYERARYLQTRYENGLASIDEKVEIMEAIYAVFIPEEIEYMMEPKYSTRKAFRRRLLEEGKAPVISVNPPFAAGLCATEAYFEILEAKSPNKRDIVRVATFPKVLCTDIGKKTMRVIELPVRPPLSQNLLA